MTSSALGEAVGPAQATPQQTQPGRPRLVTAEGIRSVGRALGMRDLSIKAVAGQLDVTPAAIYRQVPNRWALEELVGESILEELKIEDAAANSAQEHLLSFAFQLRDFALKNPGIASYLQVLFPRGAEGKRLLSTEVAALQRRGYRPEAAIMLCSAVASVSISIAASEEHDAIARHRHGAEFQEARHRINRELSTDPALGPALSGLPDIGTEDYVRLLLAAVVGGLITAAPVNRSVADVISTLSYQSASRLEKDDL